MGQTGDKASSKPAINQTAGGLTLFQAAYLYGLISAVVLFYRCLLTHQRVIAKPIPPNSTVKPDIPLTMVTHVPMAPGTTNPQTHNETLTSLLISFIYASDYGSCFEGFDLVFDLVLFVFKDTHVYSQAQI